MTTLAIIGAGNLGMNVVTALALRGRIPHVVLGARDPRRIASQVALAESFGRARIRVHKVDAAEVRSIESFLSEVRPTLLFHAATLLSPWYLLARTDPLARRLARAGFGAQLPAQLPLLMNVARACADAGIPLVNASFPDVTSPILAGLDIAPVVGVGNAGMIEARVRSACRASGAANPSLHVIAHHCHVTECIRSTATSMPGPAIWVDGTRQDELAYIGPPLRSDPSLNELTASHAVEVLEALVVESSLDTSAPGPEGLPGGYPVRCKGGRVTLRLPAGVSRDQAISWNREWAHRDGIAEIDKNGVVHWTAEAARTLAAIDSHLAEPLAPAQAMARLLRLQAAIDRPRKGN
jgi:hypothetical protein